MDIDQLILASKKRREEDEKAYKDHNSDLCMFCGAVGSDKRSLVIACFYDVKEVAPEFLERPDNRFYARICKACRGSFLGYLRKWAQERRDRRGMPMDHDGHDDYSIQDDLIPVRIDGAIQYISPAEYQRRFPKMVD